MQLYLIYKLLSNMKKISKQYFFLPYYRITIKIHTCNNDTHGLFDYETSDLAQTEFTVFNEGYLGRNGNDFNDNY
jgi:hypothetical protein